MRSNFDPVDQNNEGTGANLPRRGRAFRRVMRSNFDPVDQNNEGTGANLHENGSSTFTIDGVLYRMHHMSDGKTLVPIKASAHDKAIGGAPHTGGASVIANELVGIFPLEF